MLVSFTFVCLAPIDDAWIYEQHVLLREQDTRTANLTFFCCRSRSLSRLRVEPVDDIDDWCCDCECVCCEDGCDCVLTLLSITNRSGASRVCCCVVDSFGGSFNASSFENIMSNRREWRHKEHYKKKRYLRCHRPAIRRSRSEIWSRESRARAATNAPSARCRRPSTRRRRRAARRSSPDRAASAVDRAGARTDRRSGLRSAARRAPRADCAAATATTRCATLRRRSDRDSPCSASPWAARQTPQRCPSRESSPCTIADNEPARRSFSNSDRRASTAYTITCLKTNNDEYRSRNWEREAETETERTSLHDDFWIVTIRREQRYEMLLKHSPFAKLHVNVSLLFVLTSQSALQVLNRI